MTTIPAQQPQILFDRLCKLVVYNRPVFDSSAQVSPSTGSTLQQQPQTQQSGAGLDLSALRITFKVSQSDYETPNLAVIRVFNVNDQTARSITSEFQRVVLQGGYKNANFGTVFDGTIKQVMRGHETNVDSYVDIYAADGDIAYNNGMINTTLAAGSKPQDHLDQLSSAMGLPQGYTADLPPTALSRGKVMFGLGREHMRRLATTNEMTWSIQNGQITLVPLRSYKPGDVVVLNSSTGMIGFPQQTPGGILVTSLLNPKIQVGALVRIDNKSIIQGLAASPQALLFGQQRLESLPGFNAKISDDGLYKVLVHEYDGDTRGEEWFSNLATLAVDLSAAPGDQVKPYWAGGPS